MSTVTVKIPDEVLEGIETEAKLRRVTKARVIRERLSQSAKPSMWDLMKDLVVDSSRLPRDLSSNKKYMEGYGKIRNRR
jgi:hypothetical protein